MSARTRRRRPFLDADRPLCFAHRGGGSLWPENTLFAFERSLELGARYLETDVHATRDGVLVAHHNDAVDATTNGSGYVRDLLFSELQRLDAGYRFTEDGRTFPYRGKGLRIPKLEDVFALSIRARVNVDMKPTDPGVPKLLWELIELRALHDRILVASEYDAQLSRFRTLAAERVATSASQKEALMFWGATRLHLDHLVPVAFDALQVPKTSRGFTIVDRGFVRAAHRHGLQVHVWTIDDPSEMAELLALGVDGLISDRPDRLMQLKGGPESPF
jgi:glycerophosphoryl diester phosphodiesterase